jgi:hypothetical protein
VLLVMTETIISEKPYEHKVFFITQFYILDNPGSPKYTEQRNKESKVCLKKNSEIFDKVILLNEKIYSAKELGTTENIQQVNVHKRLSYKDVFEFIKQGEPGYYVFGNLDIFVASDFKSKVLASEFAYKKQFGAILRHEYKENSKLEDCRLFKTVKNVVRTDSQDIWIIHSNYCEDSFDDLDFLLGKPGCDNTIAERMRTKGFSIINAPLHYKIYHYHIMRPWEHSNENRTPRPYLLIKPIL